MIRLRSGSATDVGRVRANNQDNLLVASLLFAVADGMGGAAGGEVASRVAIETLKTSFDQNPDADGLVEAIRAANERVWERSQSDSQLRGMGTTVTALALVEEEGEERLVIANVGDSRAYLLRHGELQRVTDDHSLVEELVRDGQLSQEEARVHPQRHILTRAVGISDHVEPDCYRVLPVTGDRWLLASDGLFNELADTQMASVLRRFKDPGEASAELVRLAKDHGGADNITVVVIDVVDDGGQAVKASEALAGEPASLLTQRQRDAQLRALAGEQGAGDDVDDDDWDHVDEVVPDHPFDVPARKRSVSGRLVAFVVAVVLLLGAAYGSVWWYANRQYYVGLDGETVAIFRGQPGGLLWFEPQLEQRTRYRASDMRPARLPTLKAGKIEPSLAAAKAYVARLANESGADSTFQPGSTLPPTSTTIPPDQQPTP